MMHDQARKKTTHSLPNAIKVPIYVPEAMRTYLSHLAQLPGITTKGMQAEVVLRILLEFLRQKPWTTDSWQGFDRSQSCYVLVEGVRHRRPDWVQFNVTLYDIAVGNRLIPSEEIHAALTAAAATCIESRSSIDRGMTSFMLSGLKWGTTVLFDPKKFAPKQIENPFSNLPNPTLVTIPPRRMGMR